MYIVYLAVLIGGPVLAFLSPDPEVGGIIGIAMISFGLGLMCPND